MSPDRVREGIDVLSVEPRVRALRAALTIAADAAGPFAVLPEADLRRRLAQAIAEQVQLGVTDIDRLKAAALRSVASALSGIERH